MENNLTSIESRHRIFRAVKPLFAKKLGKYTHQRISGDWHFHGLGFVQGHMTYVFGFNIGFFNNSGVGGLYDSLGMNVLVRTNGYKSDLRTKFNTFFEEKLKNWYFEYGEYNSFRGGIGSEFSRYKKVSEFKNEEEIIIFLKTSILELHKIYTEILKENDLFYEVLRAGFPWLDTVGDVAENVLKN